jgi:Protein of unknown function (DUF1573)
MIIKTLKMCHGTKRKSRVELSWEFSSLGQHRNSKVVAAIVGTLMLVFFALAGPARAQLHWENPEQSFNAKSLDRVIVAKYRFANVGTQAVKIQDVKASCGCTTAAPNKGEFAPGESGEIEARFTFEGRTGKQQKAIAVTTSDSPQQPTLLRLVVNIEETVKIQPRFVMWITGEPAVSKIIRVTIGEEAPAKIASVMSDNPRVKVQIAELRGGKEYELQVTPVDTRQPTVATLTVKTDYPSDNPETRHVYARVKLPSLRMLRQRGHGTRFYSPPDLTAYKEKTP